MVRTPRLISLLTTAVPLGATCAGAGRVFAPTLTAAICLSAMVAVFFLLNVPVNAVFAGWTAGTLPADWPGCRLRWELGHAIAFVLAPTAFCTLLRAAFVEASARRGAIERRAASVDGA